MNKAKIKKVQTEITRLVARIRDLEDAAKKDKSELITSYYLKQSRAAMRASMDLTRALAELRQPD